MLHTLFSRFVLPVRDVIYPPVCFVCDRRRNPAESRLCAACWQSLTPLGSGHPALREIASRLAGEGGVSGVISCYLFERDGTMQEIVHCLKYRGITSLGVELGRRLGRKMLDERLAGPECVLVAVPLHKHRRRERGYNQSECICRGVSAITGMPLSDDLLVRRLNTASQTKLTLEERRENVRGAFALNARRASAVRGMTAILVDDVITTGSTIEACARELLAGGAGNVVAASVALAEQKNAAPPP